MANNHPTQLQHSDYLCIAERLHRLHNQTVYFYIPEAFVVDRDALTFMSMYRYRHNNTIYDFPIYTFNNKIYIHSKPDFPLGSGHRISKPGPHNAHYYPMEE